MMDALLDGGLALSLPFLAWLVLHTEALSQAVVLFVAMGLMSALAWARLEAPDIALVEAAVGTGLTGALLMHTLSWTEESQAETRTRSTRWLGDALAATVLTAVLGWAVLALPLHSQGLGPMVKARLEESGVDHPVTAVLLNFRGYDTLLEIAVLLVAALGARAVNPRTERPSLETADDPLTGELFRMTTPSVLLLAGYLVWVGAHGPGGAFQAGAILAGGGVVAILTTRVGTPRMSSWQVRWALLTGPLLFVGVAVAPLFSGGQLLEFPPRLAGTLIFIVELALTVSITLVLLMFFPAVRPPKVEHEGTP
ncbi:hydrogen gas-evolving membrane-bound hydrogenase subunit E [Myxococcus stipitatus]|uniref:hydrogen gas-evolving membrane-bound hydrogenase subunit E n=1 Tax=Myxococcus stipitatus TaxID=83455 RepID=UPI0030D3F464